MSAATAALAVLRRDALVFASYRLRPISQVLTIVFSLLLFEFIARLVRVPPFETPGAYFGFVVVGLLALNLVTSVLQGAQASLQREMAQGSLEPTAVSAFGPVGALCSLVAFPALLSIANGVVTVGAAAAFFELDVAWPSVFLAIPVALLASAAFAPLGFLIIAATLLFKQTAAATTWVLSGIAIVAGFYFPTSLLPSWVEWLSEVQPFTPAVDLLRHVVLDLPLGGSALDAVVRLVGFAVVLTPVAVVVLRAAVRRAQAVGSIVEA
jgi:ABC-2 type transport system permease protein